MASGLVDLTIEECLEHLSSGVVGRVAMSTPMGPRIVPLNYGCPGRNVQANPGAPGTGRPGMPGSGNPGMPSRGGVPKSLAGRGQNPVRSLQTPPKATPTTGLGGRTAPKLSRAETLKSAQAALRRNLAGRPSKAAGAHSIQSGGLSASQKRREDADAVPFAGMVGDHELFDVDENAPAVLKRGEERGPVKRSGPALGVG